MFGSCFELFSASTAFYITLAIFAPSTRKDLVDVYRTCGISAVQKKLTQITTSTAQASQPADQRAIKEIVNQLPEGFTTLDSIMRDKLSALVMETLANEEGGMTDEQALHQELQSTHEQNSVLHEEVSVLQAKNEELKRQLKCSPKYRRLTVVPDLPGASNVVDCKVTKGLQGLGIRLQKQEVGYSVEAFNDMPEGIPNPTLNADPPIEVGDRIVAINNVKVSTSSEIAGEVRKVEAGTVFVIQMERYI